MSFDITKFKQQMDSTSIIKSSSSSLDILKQNTSLSNLSEKKALLESELTESTSMMLDIASKLIKETSIELLVVIDNSPSCSGKKNQTMEEYNNLIANLKSEKNPIKLSTIIFSEDVIEYEYRSSIQDVKKLEYDISSGTRLYDTLCNYILRIRDEQTKDDIRPTHTVVMIMTDGDDNLSNNYNINDIKRLIEQCKEDGWIFIVMGSLENTKAISQSVKIDSKYALDYIKPNDGVEAVFSGMYKLIGDIRNNAIMSDSDEVKKLLKEDIKRLEYKK